MKEELERLLRGKVKTVSVLQDIILFVQKEKDYLMNRYDYLGLREEVIDKAIIETFKETIDLIPFKSNFKKQMRKRVEVFIRKKLAKKDKNFFGNLIIKAKSMTNTKIDILRYINEELREFNISLGEEDYEFYKNNVVSFKMLLEGLGISDFSYKEYLDVINNKYEVYLFCRGKDKSLRETLELFNEVNNLLIDKVFFTKPIYNKRVVKKIKFILSKYDYIEDIYGLYIRKYGVILRDSFKRILFNLEEEELKRLFFSYQDYISGNKSDTLYLDIIADKLSESNKGFREPKNSIKIITWENRYDYFFDYTINVGLKRAFVDKELEKIEKENPERIENIKGFLDYSLVRRTKEAKIARRDIDNIKLALNKYLETKELPDFDTTLDLDFTLDKDNPLDIQKEVIRKLLSSLAIRKQKLMKDYWYGLVNNGDLKELRAIHEEIKEQYDIWKRTGLLPQDYYLMDLFMDIGFTKEELLGYFEEIGEKRLKLLIGEYKLIEIEYRGIGLKRKEYLRYLKEKMEELKSSYSFLEMLEKYGEISQKEIKEMRECRSM